MAALCRSKRLQNLQYFWLKFTVVGIRNKPDWNFFLQIRLESLTNRTGTFSYKSDWNIFLQIESGDSALFEVPIRAKVLGEIDLSVTGRVGAVSDTVKRKLKVKVGIHIGPFQQKHLE